ncbi:MAG: hypothetical protein COB45_01730 [Gammaproteobacteria bacterium]|nr:MAG: hypothetical protein COB45_01730 [Gammaproteobacteria bacterium]
MSKVKIIYLMGAGRSGTTALATFLNASENVTCLGELHQLPQYITENSACSCGQPLSECDFWSNYRETLKPFISTEYSREQQVLESHRSVIKYLKSTFSASKLNYHKANADLLTEVKCNTGNAILDSAKYVGRALALFSNDKFDVRVIYMTRDPRGVVESFAKKVQTSRSMFSACLYYNAINFLAEFACRTILRRRYLKVRYEDLLNEPINTFNNIGQFADIDVNDIISKIEHKETFAIGHIVGGNRMKTAGAIEFRKTDNWPSKISHVKRLAVYGLTLPFNLLNRYKP